MKNSKRFIALLMAAALSIGTFAGCGKASTGEGETGTTDPASPEEPTSITVASTGTYYPFGFMEDGVAKGFEIDVWDKIGELSGLKVERKFAAYSGLFGMLDKGDIDTIANQVSWNPERDEKYYFSETYAYNPLKIAVKKGNPENIQGIEDLVGKKVVVGTGGNEGDEIRKLYPNGEITLVPYEGEELMDVENGKMSACVQSAAAVSVEIKDKNRDIEIVGAPIYIEKNAYAFAKTARGEALKAKVDAALIKMHEDGTLTELSNKWFGMDITQESPAN